MYQLHVGITFYVRLPAFLIHERFINYHNSGVGLYYIHFILPLQELSAEEGGGLIIRTIRYTNAYMFTTSPFMSDGHRL